MEASWIIESSRYIVYLSPNIFFESLRYIGGSEDRDFVDRLHSYFTCNILIALSIMVSFKQFGGKPVSGRHQFEASERHSKTSHNRAWNARSFRVNWKHGNHFPGGMPSAPQNWCIMRVRNQISLQVECLVPDMFSSAWEQYAENYCWAQDTYFVPEGKAVAGMDDREKRVR